jgi:hypothetical protein
MKWNSIEIYREAQSIEMMLIKNGAIPNKDYTILELFKIAAENLKTEALLDIGSAIGDLQELKSK